MPIRKAPAVKVTVYLDILEVVVPVIRLVHSQSPIGAANQDPVDAPGTNACDLEIYPVAHIYSLLLGSMVSQKSAWRTEKIVTLKAVCDIPSCCFSLFSLCLSVTTSGYKSWPAETQTETEALVAD